MHNVFLHVWTSFSKLLTKQTCKWALWSISCSSREGKRPIGGIEAQPIEGMLGSTIELSCVGKGYGDEVL